MALTNQNAYQELALDLFNRIDATSVDQREKLEEYREITKTFFMKCDLFDNLMPDGYAMELFLWIGLKFDSPEMAKKYRKTIQETWPGVFE